MAQAHFIGVDVGSESVRAGLFTENGELFAVAKCPIRIWRAPGGVAEQSSAEIWTAICKTVRHIVNNRNAAEIGAIGFCATCSLVVADSKGNPLQISPKGNGANDGSGQCRDRDIIMWMDHRAMKQAERINSTGNEILRFTGGRISPEMQLPKLLWLKENRYDIFTRGHFFDLADWCTWKASGGIVDRSICTVTCKWTYLAHQGGFNANFFHQIGLSELAEENFQRIGQSIRQIGQPIGSGLAEETAIQMGLKRCLPIASGLIDAHAGALGTITGPNQMALIMGTSACTMNLSKSACFVPGIWGPYYGVVWPGHWLNEGGITAFGSALQFALKMHPFYHEERRKYGEDFDDSKMIEKLEQKAIQIAGNSLEACSTAFGQNLHICPEFLGNRSPDADPHAGASIIGLRMDSKWASEEEELVEWMVVVMTALCCQVRHIIEALEKHENGTIEIDEIVVSGGMAHKSALLIRLLSDMTRKRVIVPDCQETVLLGAALNGAVAAGHFGGSIEEGSKKMVASQGGFGLTKVIQPQSDEKVCKFHAMKYAAYQKFKKCEREVRNMSSQFI